MILTMDVGNSTIFIGLFVNDELIESWRISTDRNKTSDEYGIILRQLIDTSSKSLEEVEGIIISSVVPTVMSKLKEMASRYFSCNVIVVGPGIKTGMNIKTENPKEVGSDRIVNAVAASQKYEGPTIIVDFGTATTICAVSKYGDYLGGAIAPGIEIATEALFEKAAKLPKIELSFPKTAIGKNTEDSIKSGIIFGFAGQVDALITRFKTELSINATVIATGGLVNHIAPEIEAIDRIEPYLTLEGLNYLAGLNGFLR
ncbi:MAG: type III pantothenate kinase [Bacillota bacterium]